MNKIDSFTGEYFFLSNFSPSKIVYEGLTYNSVEHAYQAAKTEDISVRIQIQNAPSPAVAKKLGKKITLRENWEKIKVPIMLELLRQKFSREDKMNQLLATNNYELIEGNNWGDCFWGICNNKGKNYLGKLLMLVRTECSQKNSGIYS